MLSYIFYLTYVIQLLICISMLLFLRFQLPTAFNDCITISSDLYAQGLSVELCKYPLTYPLSASWDMCTRGASQSSKSANVHPTQSGFAKVITLPHQFLGGL